MLKFTFHYIYKLTTAHPTVVIQLACEQIIESAARKGKKSRQNSYEHFHGNVFSAAFNCNDCCGSCDLQGKRRKIKRKLGKCM